MPATRQPIESHDAAKTPVVTAFIWNGRHVLLALRSQQVSTFPGHWAGISGYLEGDDPAAWALVEIEQETGLGRAQLTLRRAGQPLEAYDAATGRTFVVHPFLFSVPEATAVDGDWEADRLEWVDLDDLIHRRRTPVVPRLYDAFDRVWPPWPAEQAFDANLKLALRGLDADRQMGAGTLARAAGAEACKLAALCPDQAFADWRLRLERALDALGAVRPSMAAPRNLMQDFREALDRADTRDEFLQTARQLIDRSRAAEQALARTVARRIEPGTCVLTISYSSTVRRALQGAAERLQRVLICESRPLCEGRRLAAELHGAGIAVTVLTEAQIPLFMPQADLVLLGADSVLPGRGAVNKVGSTLVALAARRCDKPVVIAAEPLKWVRDACDEMPAMESGPAEEVWPDAPAGIAVSNTYFELIPSELISEYVDPDDESLNP